MKMAVIAGASEAIKHKSNNPQLSNDEVIKHVARNVENIIENIDE
ncbi:MAG: hypothetical protein WC781_00025 [Candidatus Pacearchaeota archaeon]